MPEATMDKDNLPSRHKNQIGLSRKVSDVKGIAIAHGMN
jgi:hypothetical protein